MGNKIFAVNIKNCSQVDKCFSFKTSLYKQFKNIIYNYNYFVHSHFKNARLNSRESWGEEDGTRACVILKKSSCKMTPGYRGLGRGTSMWRNKSSMGGNTFPLRWERKRWKWTCMLINKYHKIMWFCTLLPHT